MPQDVTTRHALPLLYVGQSQKELTHNEALARIDALLHPVVLATLSTPPATPLDGQCWLVGTAATGLWIGRESQIARWSGGSWRFLLPATGMSLWHISEAKRYFYISGGWRGFAAIANPAAGTVIDAEARSAIAAILTLLRQIGAISA
jgi:Protein of unknown function (DUF2793)